MGLGLKLHSGEGSAWGFNLTNRSHLCLISTNPETQVIPAGPRMGSSDCWAEGSTLSGMSGWVGACPVLTVIISLSFVMSPSLAPA